MKKLMLFFISLSFCFSNKAQTFEYEGIYYEFIDALTLKVVQVPNEHDQYSGNIVIPETVYETYSVVAIGDFAFYDCQNLISVLIPRSVISIGYEAFSGCVSLTSVTIPEGVTSIGNSVFSGCANLTSITIPESVTSIGYRAFQGCNLISLTIPKNVSLIGGAAFSCPVDVSTDNPNFIVKDNVLFSKDLSTLVLYPSSLSAKEYTIPNGVITIGEMAFFESSLTEIIIPNSVKKIDIGAFGGCKLRSITLPESITSIGWSAFSDCADLESINIPDGVTSIEDYTFLRCWKLRSIVLPDYMSSIGRVTFANCTSLESINIPKGITSIDDQAFSNCSSLTSITIPEGVTSIGNSAFSYCSGLTSLTIPKETVSIENNCFEYCTNLNDIYVYNPTPIYLYNDVFPSEIYSYAVLHVPQNTASVYRSAGEWANFSTVVDDISTGTLEHYLLTTKIFASSNGIVIENSMPGVQVCIYDESGVLVETLQTKFHRTEVKLPVNKIYIVKIARKTIKVKL